MSLVAVKAKFSWVCCALAGGAVVFLSSAVMIRDHGLSTAKGRHVGWVVTMLRGS